MSFSSLVILALSDGQSSLASLGLMSFRGVSSAEGVIMYRILTSDCVQMTPTFDSAARRASSNTSFTPASVVALPILATANIWWHCLTYRSVMFCRAKLRSRSPTLVNIKLAVCLDLLPTWEIR